MNMIKIKGDLKIDKIATIVYIPLGLILALVGAANNWSDDFIIFWELILLVIFVIIAVVDENTPWEIRYDEYWLMTKHLMLKEEIKMDDITEVRYYIKIEGSGGEPFKCLIMEIVHTGGKLKLKEMISNKDIENCKRGKGDMELFILYRFFEREYPKKAKGYWRFCGF